MEGPRETLVPDIRLPSMLQCRKKIAGNSVLHKLKIEPASRAARDSPCPPPF